jgi:hypothetical protein
MRRFYLLGCDVERSDLQAVCRRDVGSFVTSVFRNGKPFLGEVPDTVRLWLTEGKPSHYLSNPLSWPIVSGQFAEIARCFSQDFQLFPAPTYSLSDKRPVTGYYVLNVTRCISAVDFGKASAEHFNILGINTVHVTRFVFDEKLIASDIHIFRPNESIEDIIVSSQFAEKIKHLDGVALIDT